MGREPGEFVTPLLKISIGTGGDAGQRCIAQVTRRPVAAFLSRPTLYSSA